MRVAEPPAPDAIAELTRGARRFGLRLPAEAITRFRTYLDVILQWRQRVSLTTATTPLALVREHLLDSLAVARFVKPGDRVADLGSGGGLPGVPLAIVCPAASVALIEPRRKKANFLRAVARAAPLPNVEVVEARAEALLNGDPETYDLVVSRAVWQLRDFLPLAARLLRPTGLAVALKGPKALAQPRCSVRGLSQAEIVRYELPGGISHWLFVYRKTERST
ncbi:MAG: 16S rRNA (guanine(527)-N(7))-methyltransferase RsmG [Candidatus Binatia bacterium]